MTKVINIREGLSTLRVSYAALLVREFIPNCFFFAIKIHYIAGRQLLRVGGGAQRPVLRVKEPKKWGARSVVQTH